MTSEATFAVVLVLVSALVVAPVAAAVPSGGPAATYAPQETDTPDQADGNASVAPGERLSGAVGVQQAEIEGEVRERTFGVKVAKANSDDAKAKVVAETLDDVEGRLDDLEQRKQTLREARENGSMSEGEYRAKMAKVAAETETVERMANASERTAEGLPAETLEANGVDAEAIQALKDRAGNLSGPEVAEIARSIGGPDAGTSMGGEQRPEEVGDQVPDDAGDRTDGAGDQAGDRTGETDNETAGDRAGNETAGSDAGGDQP